MPFHFGVLKSIHVSSTGTSVKLCRLGIWHWKWRLPKPAWPNFWSVFTTSIVGSESLRRWQVHCLYVWLNIQVLLSLQMIHTSHILVLYNHLDLSHTCVYSLESWTYAIIPSHLTCQSQSTTAFQLTRVWGVTQPGFLGFAKNLCHVAELSLWPAKWQAAWCCSHLSLYLLDVSGSKSGFSTI